MSEGFNPIVEWKIERMAEDGRIVPRMEVLSPEEGAQVRLWLLDATRLAADADNRTLADALYAAANKHSLGDLDDDRDVPELFNEAGILSDELLILIPMEGGFDSGVRIARQDLIDFLDDIWYPSRDDLIVIDEANRVLLLINHHEHVGVMALGLHPLKERRNLL